MPSALTPGIKTDIRYGTYDCIKSITKTGMLFGSLDVLTGFDYAKKSVPTASGTDGRNYWYANDLTRKYDNPYVTNACEASFWINGVCVYSIQPCNMGLVRNVGSGDSTKTASASLFIVPNPGRYSFMFFV